MQQCHNFLRINDNFDARSIISEPMIQCSLVQAPLIQQQAEPLTFIRKYITTKTTTTGIPPPMMHEQMLSNTQHRQMASSCSQLQKDQYGMQPNTRFRCASSQQNSNSGFQAQQGFRSASIPPPQKFNFENGALNQGGTTSRYYSSSTTTDHQRPQPIIRETRNSSQQYNSSGYSHGTFPQQKNFQTLPVNFNQVQMNKMNSSNNDHMSGYNSCIDYSNSHFRNGDGNEKPIIKPVPQTIPIHQQ